MDVTLERVIAGTSLLADLDPSERAQVAALMHPFEVGSGEVLFREGEIADRLHLIAHMVEAVHLVANEGWKLLPLYRLDSFSGQWHHRDGRSRPAVGLYDVHYDTGEMEFRGQAATAPETELVRQLEEASGSSSGSNGRRPKRTRSSTFSSARSSSGCAGSRYPGEALSELRAADPAR